MVKAYLRYELSSTFGVVTSNSALLHDTTGKLVVTAALENVAIWNLRQGTLVSYLRLFINSKQTINPIATWICRRTYKAVADYIQMQNSKFTFFLG